MLAQVTETNFQQLHNNKNTENERQKKNWHS